MSSQECRLKSYKNHIGKADMCMWVTKQYILLHSVKWLIRRLETFFIDQEYQLGIVTWDLWIYLKLISFFTDCVT